MKICLVLERFYPIFYIDKPTTHMQITQKRYQYFSSDGISWTKWFQSSESDEKWQIKNKLKNEYRTVEKHDFVPEIIADLAVKHCMCEETDKKKFSNHLARHGPSLYIIQSVDGIESAHMLNMMAKSKYFKEGEKELFLLDLTKINS